MSVILQNIILGISLAAPIGPANVAVMKQGFSKGFFFGFITGLGVVTADLFYLLVIYFGISPFFKIPIIQTAIWILGAIILFLMGYRSIKEFFNKTDFNEEKPKEKNAFLEGFLINISNPMAIVWWTGVFGASLSESLNLSADKLKVLFSSMAIIVGLLIWVFTVALLTHWGKRFLNEKSMGYISLIAGLLLIIFGLKFGYNAVTFISNAK